MRTIKRFEKCRDGYWVHTSTGEILVLYIDDKQDCCENAGFFMSEDVLDDYLGAEILKVEVVDTELKVGLLESKLEYGLDEGGAMFVNIVTNKGTLQFTAYNSHNGYYGHQALVYWLKPKMIKEAVL